MIAVKRTASQLSEECKAKVELSMNILLKPPKLSS